jgi:three-Cys-motif partner protein
MTRSDDHFEEFQPHTRHKHVLLQHYFMAWGHKLGLRAGSGTSILYVDACAGRGVDDIANQGSPLIASVAATSAQANVAGRRGEEFRIHVRAVESNRDHYRALTELLAPFAPGAQVLEGTLADHMDDLDREFTGIPALFFIDPFGLAPLHAAVIRRALDGERREALLLFADQAALRHFGVITAQETRAERRHRAAATPLPLFPEMASPNVDALANAAAESRAHLETTRGRAIQIMNTAFGDDEWLSEIEAVPQHRRREAFLEIYARRLRSWGASHVLPIPVVDVSGTHAYTLIHASKSPKAYATMKETVAYSLKHSPLPDAVTARMRDLVRSDPERVDAMVRRHFAGQTVRWAVDAANQQAPCVRNYVLQETPAFPFELDGVKSLLSPLRSPGRAIVYAFPQG